MSPGSDDKTILTGQAIADEGLDGWRLVFDRLRVRYATGDFNTGTDLVRRIAEAADEADHHPDVDLRYPHVTVSLRSHDVAGITRRDLRLARRISEIAAAAGIGTTDHAPDSVEIALDTPDLTRVLPFWRAMLGYSEGGTEQEAVWDAADRLPPVWFQATESTAPDRQRWHLDISVPHDAVEERIRAALDAGGRLVDESRAPSFWVLEDADGNKGCLCTWQARD